MDEYDLTGKEIGNYRIIAEIKSGASGSVYKAENTHLKEHIVAIKFLHEHLGSPKEREQFTREAQFLAMLEHPHILPLYDFGFRGRQPYLVIHYAAGGSLRDYLKRQEALPIDKAVTILTEIGQGLHYAHKRQIIHRDLKPENILFNTQGDALLADFGIAIMLSTASEKHLTTIGGTPPYMAPEQFQGNISKEGDQYALGCIAYELLTGYPPFSAPDFLSMGFKHLTEQPLRLTHYNSQIPAPIEEAILKAMAKQRAERHTDIPAFLTALQAPFTQITTLRAAPPATPTPVAPSPASPLPLPVASIQPPARIVPSPASSTPRPAGLIQPATPGRPSPAASTPRSEASMRRPVPPTSTPKAALPVTPPPQSRLAPSQSPIPARSTPAPSTSKPATPFRLRDLFMQKRPANKPPVVQLDTPAERQLYTALDIGTANARAMIIEVQDDIGVVLGVGRHRQSYSHMSDGIVTDIPGVIANCNAALLQAEANAGGLIAPNTIMGIAGELVKGSSTTLTKQRQHPSKPITPEELESAISSAQQKLLRSAKERIAMETGYPNIEIRLTNSAVISVMIDGQAVDNPIGFRGRHFTLTLFSAFAPLMQLGALQTVAQGLDLTLITIVAEPYALARCLSRNASADSGAIFIDISGGTTDIALVRQGGIEETRIFALGGRTFTRRLSSHKGLSLKDAEQLKIDYSRGNLQGNERDEVQRILAPEVQTWIDSVELLVEELARGELLPPAIYLVGGGSALPDLYEKLVNFPWTERLPFARQPFIDIVQPGMVTGIADPQHLLTDAQDITPMSLAYQAVELQNEDSILENSLYQVIQNMHI